MKPDCSLRFWMTGSETLFAFLPLALAGFSTALILGVQSFIGLFSDHGQKFQQDPSISKGALR